MTEPLHTSLQTQPQPGPATPLFAAAWLALNRAAEACFACCALLFPCDRPRYISVTYLDADPTPARASPPLFAAAWLALKSWCCGGALCVLRFALPRYRPGCIAVTYLVTDPTPARASDPAFCRSLACVDALLILLVRFFCPLQTCVTRTSVTDLRNKIRAASRVTDP